METTQTTQTIYNLLVGTTKIPFPNEFIPYSKYIQNIKGMSHTVEEEDEDGSGSEDECEDPGIPNVGGETFDITLKDTTTEIAQHLVGLLCIHCDANYSNIDPEPKKVTDDKFKIEEGLGAGERGKQTIELFEKIDSLAVQKLATLAGFLDIALVKHLCFTWICHKLNTIKTTREKMNWIGIPTSVEEPDFETILHINLKTGEIPNSTSTTATTATSEGGADK